MSLLERGDINEPDRPGKNLLNIINEGLCIVDNDHRVLWANTVYKNWVPGDARIEGGSIHDHLTFEHGTCLDPSTAGEIPSNSIGICCMTGLDSRGRKRFYFAKCVPRTNGGRVTSTVVSVTDNTGAVLANRIFLASMKCMGDYRSLVNQFIDTMFDTFSVSTSCIFFRDRQSNEISLIGERGFDTDIVKKISRQSPFKTANGIATITVERKSPLYMENFDQDPIIKKYDPDMVRRMKSESLLSVPLYSYEEVYGTFQITTSKGVTLSLDDIRLIKQLASHLSMGIYTCKFEEDLSQARDLLKFYVDILGHDINNMNQSALGFMELAVNDPLISENSKNHISKAMSSVKNSSRLIEKVSMLRKISRQKGFIKRVDLNEVITDCIISIQSSAIARDVTVRYVPQHGTYVAANELLREAFLNIMENSVKYGECNVVIDISVEYEAGNDRYRVILEDNGPGIPDEVKDRVFEKYWRGVMPVSGKGMGLYIVHTIVRSYGGKVEIADRVPGRPSCGAKFIITVPGWK